MKLSYSNTPFPLAIIDDYFSLRSIGKMTREGLELIAQHAGHSNNGSAQDSSGQSLRRGQAVFLDPLFAKRNESFLITESERLLASSKLWKKVSESGDWFIVPTLRCSNFHSTLLNAYWFQNEYLAHRDNARLSFLITLLPNGSCEGGELVFPEHEVTIPARHNRVVVFPGIVEHAILPITSNRGTAPSRLSLALFLDLIER